MQAFNDNTNNNRYSCNLIFSYITSSGKIKHRHTGIAAVLDRSAELLIPLFCLQQSFKSYQKLPLTEEKIMNILIMDE